MIDYSLPGLHSCFELNKAFMLVVEENRECLRPGVGISSVYGCFPPAIWNGGRKVNGFCSIEQIKEELFFWNSRNIGCRLTFTNMELKKEHLHDSFCNMLLDVAYNDLNGIIVNSEILEEYIKKKYPKYKIISSTTKCLKNIEELEKECNKDNDIVVLDYSLNHSEQLKFVKFPEKIEILVNAYCCDNCPERLLHYLTLSKSQLAYEENSGFHTCPFVLEDFYTIKDTRKSFVSVEEIMDYYSKIGISYFKIEGRTNNMFDVLESYIYYLIKKEYADRVRLHTLRKVDNV